MVYGKSLHKQESAIKILYPLKALFSPFPSFGEMRRQKNAITRFHREAQAEDRCAPGAVGLGSLRAAQGERAHSPGGPGAALPLATYVTGDTGLCSLQ